MAKKKITPIDEEAENPAPEGVAGEAGKKKPGAPKGKPRKRGASVVIAKIEKDLGELVNVEAVQSAFKTVEEAVKALYDLRDSLKKTSGSFSRKVKKASDEELDSMIKALMAEREARKN